MASGTLQVTSGTSNCRRCKNAHFLALSLDYELRTSLHRATDTPLELPLLSGWQQHHTAQNPRTVYSDHVPCLHRYKTQNPKLKPHVGTICGSLIEVDVHRKAARGPAQLSGRAPVHLGSILQHHYSSLEKQTARAWLDR